VLDNGVPQNVPTTVAPVAPNTKPPKVSKKKTQPVPVVGAGNNVENNTVVKQFFKSLLTSQKGTSGDRRDRAKVQQYLKTQTEEAAGGTSTEDPSRSTRPMNKANTDTSQG